MAAFPAALDAFRVDPAQRRYVVAFDWLERVLGFRAAYLHFLPLTFWRSTRTIRSRDSPWLRASWAAADMPADSRRCSPCR